MAIGLNRHNDTPIGGAEEFRGNMQGGEVYGVDDVPVWDGEKFSPGTNSALLNAYGGLAHLGSPTHAADGTPIDDWDQITPINGTPLQVSPVTATGIITATPAGVYNVSFNASVANLGNNLDYFFELARNGAGTGFGIVVTGSNNVSTQSVGFSITVDGTGNGTVAVVVTEAGGGNYDVISATLEIQRIG